jgi:hypothetical protein
MSFGRPIALSAPVLMMVAALLIGCAGSGPAAAPPAPTVTVTSAPQEAEKARAASDPLTALDAWNACSSAAQAVYSLHYQGSAVQPYSEAQAPQKNPDGSFSVNIRISPSEDAEVSGGIVGICTIKGTVGAPQIVSFTLKDL